MNVVAISNRVKSTFFSSLRCSECSMLKRKNIFFRHDCDVVDVIAMNVFFIIPKPNIFHDHGLVNVALK